MRPKPSKAQIAGAYGKKVADLMAPALRVLFVGINPSLYSAAVGHHFARPSNRFWPTLYRAGFTPHLFLPSQGMDLLALGYGITNLVARATATADELSVQELRQGARRLKRKVSHSRPAFVAFLGVSAYRMAFARLQAAIGRQQEQLGASALWVLPNPSGLNAHYQLADLARLFAELRAAAST